MNAHIKGVFLLIALLGSAGCDALFKVEGRFWDAQGNILKNCWADVFILPENEYFDTIQFFDRTSVSVIVGPVKREYSFVLHCPGKHTTIAKGPFLFEGNFGDDVPKFDAGDVVFAR